MIEMNIEKAIEVLKMDNELMQFDPMTGEIEPIELQNQDNQDLYKANLIAIMALEKQLNGGWIPVSERLPEVCGLGVLLTIENIYEQRKVIKGFTGYMEKGKLEFHTNDKTTNLEIWKVIAWMPLPSVYVEVENE